MTEMCFNNWHFERPVCVLKLQRLMSGADIVPKAQRARAACT